MMIEAQDWLAPLLGTAVLLLIALSVAGMCHSVLSRMRLDDARSHEHRLDRRTLPTRKEEERARLKVLKQWDRIEGYVRARNFCLLAALAIVEVNLGLIVLAVTGHSAALSLSLLAVLVLVFAAGCRLALKKPQRPVWATTPGYYRDLAMGETGRSEEGSE